MSFAECELVPRACRPLRHVTDNNRFVEYETQADLKTAVEKLDRHEFKGQEVMCTQDVSDPPPPPPFKPRAPYGGPGGPDDRGRDRYRSRSPGGRRGGGYPPAPYDDYYDRRGPPRGYSPRRGGGDDYRRRSPPREFYESRERYGRSPPRGAGEYSAPRPRYPEDPYDAVGLLLVAMTIHTLTALMLVRTMLALLPPADVREAPEAVLPSTLSIPLVVTRITGRLPCGIILPGSLIR